MILLYALTTFTVSALLTYFIMPVLLRFCVARGLFDMPNDRKVHHNKIPRLGGVLFAPATMMGMAAVVVIMLLQGRNDVQFGLSSVLLFVALFLIYIIGIVDDILGLDAKIKFAVQVLAAIFMPLCNLYINNLYGFCGIYEIPVWVGYPLTILVFLLIVNAINLIDGIDGLASGLCVICLTVFSVVFTRLSLPYSLFTFGLLGTVLAFMYFNLFGNVERSTKTFMGDTGSLILGYSIAYFCIKYAMFNPMIMPIHVHDCPILLSFSLVFIPVIDLVRVAIERTCKGKGMFTPDKTHIHHLCMAACMSMHATMGFILCMQLLIVGANMLLFHVMKVGSTWLVLSNFILYAIVVVMLRVQSRKRINNA